MSCIRFAALVVATILILPSQARAAVLFTDSFNTAASAANYTVVTSDATSSFPTYAYDYSALGIPSAPNSGDNSTFGLKLDANNGPGTATAEGITLHTLLSFSGDYRLKFDAWLNVNGPFGGGGSGSTNYLTAGVGGDGITNNRGPSNAANAGLSGVGGWTAVNGENGNGNDYRLQKDTVVQDVASGQYAAVTDGNGDLPRDGDNDYYAPVQPLGVIVDNLPVQGGQGNQTGTSFVGSFGMDWHEVELIVDADGGTGGAASMQWLVDGLLIGTLDAGANGSFSANGRATLGYYDPTANASDAPQYSFALIDNLTVVPEPASFILLAIAFAGLSMWRRR